MTAILFDEPLTVIDPHLKWQLRSQLKELHREFDLTMVYVTHDQTEALTFADKVVVMYEGEVVQIGTPEDLFERPAHTFVGYFIGSPGMNVLPAEIRGDRAFVAGEHAVDLARAYPDLPDGARLELGVRPEFVRLTGNGAGLPVTRAAGRRHRPHEGGARSTSTAHALNVLAAEDARIDGDHARIVFDPGHVHVYADGHLVGGKSRLRPWTRPGTTEPGSWCCRC